MDVLVCDLDGVLYRGRDVVPGAPEALAELRERGIKPLFCTNNSRATVADLVARLDGLGIAAAGDEIVTSAVVTAETLAARGLAGSVALVVGGEGIRAALTDCGIEVVDGPRAPEADLVVVGWDPGFDYEQMKAAALAIRAGATLVATNDDAAYPAPDGLWPGAGAILASIEVASGVTAEVMGKPHDPMLDAIARRAGGGAKIAAIGDRPETDLAGARRRGWRTILALSGVTDAAGAADLDPAPDYIVETISELPKMLQ